MNEALEMIGRLKQLATVIRTRNGLPHDAFVATAAALTIAGMQQTIEELQNKIADLERTILKYRNGKVNLE